MQLLKKSQMKETPWKNGLGVTTEIAIFPKGANFADGDFLWRVSSAQVRDPSLFSQFNGYDRVLAIWKGAGLLLNGKKLPPLEPFEFRGEELIASDPRGDEVHDLGVIFRRGEVDVKMHALRLEAGKTQAISGCRFLFCVSGQLECGTEVLKEGDALIFEPSEELKVACKGEGGSALAIELEVKA
jgi:environmental stress-induced protein Ves